MLERLRKSLSAFRKEWQLTSRTGSSPDVPDDIKSDNLPFVLYLNQRFVFDIIATLRGGFSEFSIRQTASNATTITDKSFEIGSGNPFALLEIATSQQSSYSRDTKTLEKVIQTPTSLFAQFRKELYDRNSVIYLTDVYELSKIQVGDFVEMQGSLGWNPLIELQSIFNNILPFVELVDVDNKGGTKNKGQRREFDLMKTSLNTFFSAAIPKGSQDLIMVNNEFKAVLTVEEQYFNDSTMNNIIDGTFRIFGKIIRVITSGDMGESISLLRQTPLQKVEGGIEVIHNMMRSIKESPIDLETDTLIRGPAIQVLPVAIFR